MNIFQKLDILASIFGVNESVLDPEIILDSFPQWNSATQKALVDYVKKTSGFTVTPQRLETLTTIQDVLDLMG